MASNSLTAGELMAFLVASQGVQRSLSQGSVLLGTVIRGMTAGTRIFEVRHSYWRYVFLLRVASSSMVTQMPSIKQPSVLGLEFEFVVLIVH